MSKICSKSECLAPRNIPFPPFLSVRRSDWNIQQIITYVGYENTSYFYRLFHERYGQSPREYRQSRAVRTRTLA